MQDLSIAVDGARYAYLKSGSGPALVIIHGVGGHKEDWQGVMEACAPRRTVFAVDMLGFGGSSREAKDLSMPGQAAAIKALLAHEGIGQADVIGNSVGGWAGATFAAAHPGLVRKLVLVDPAGFKAMFEGEPAVNLFPDDVGQMKKLLSFVLHSPFAQTDAFAAEAFAKFEAGGEKAIVPRLFPALLGSPKLEEVLPELTVPTLVVWGKEDRLFPVELAPYITGLAPGATSVIVENASHFPQVDNPKDFMAAIAGFLD